MANYIRNTIASLVAAASMSGCAAGINQIQGNVTEKFQFMSANADKYQRWNGSDIYAFKINTKEGQVIVGLQPNIPAHEKRIQDSIDERTFVVFKGISNQGEMEGLPCYLAKSVQARKKTEPQNVTLTAKAN